MDDLQVIPASSPASSASDSDAFNTASARLHFGPLKTPERRLVAMIQRNPSPQLDVNLRRSPRLSSPLAEPGPSPRTLREMDEVEHAIELMIDEDGYDSNNSRQGTPGGSAFLNEPSSALADKVMRAHDNPSPPPSPPPNFYDANVFSDELPKSPHTFLFTPGLVNMPFSRHPLASLNFASSSPTPASPRLPSPSTSTSLQSSSIRRVSQTDLISFDSFPGPSLDKPSTALLPSVDSSSTLLSINPSVDDLLSRSPSPSRSTVSFDFTGLPAPALIVVPPPQDKTDSNLIKLDQGQTPRSCIDASQQASICLQKASPPPLDRDNEISNQDSLTPLRRSTRPRRSVTPNPSPFDSPSPNAGGSSLVAAPPSARTQRKRKAVSDVLLHHPVSNDAIDSTTNLAESTTLQTLTTDNAKGKGRSRGFSSLAFQREVGSLSPTSADLLSRLVSPPLNPESVNVVDGDSNAITWEPCNQPMPSFSIFPPASPSPVPVIDESPTISIRARSRSPARTSIPSPSKHHTQSSLLDVSTPARRMLVQDAIQQGHLSPQKAALTGLKKVHGPNFGVPATPVFNIPRNDSPARRVLIPEAPIAVTPKVQRGLRFGSPTRSPSKEQAMANEHKGSSVLTSKADKNETMNNLRPIDTVRGTPSSSQGKSTRLPFPLVPAPKDVPLSLHTKRAESSSPAKSNLKQSSSKIPRIGAKPYARPTSAKPTTQIKVMRTAGLAKPGGPSMKPAEETSKAVVNLAARSKPGESSTMTATLKRKRTAEMTSPAAKPRPVVLLRQVPSVASSKVTPASAQKTISTTISATRPPPSAPTVKPAVIRIRRVVDREPSVSNKTTSPHTLNASSSVESVESISAVPFEAPSVSEPAHYVPDSDVSPGSPMVQEPPTTLPHSSPDLLPEEISLNEIETSASLFRRTTRARKSLQDDDTKDSDTRPLQPRRRANTQQSSKSEAVFLGMSATALKALTTSNTVRNQQYLAAKLKTEVIRKEGIRPESPVVKVRTISQRQQEERGKQRKERAERRARRNENDSLGTSDNEGYSDTGYSSPTDVETEWPNSNMALFPRHTRGAGDDDDYETPDRRRRNSKRLKFTAEDEDDSDGEIRRVKWDKGLYTTVFLDQVKLGTRQPSKEENARKGCLARTAKAARLDTLGNLTNAEAPLPELVEESIIVKKFVYDNDVEPVQEVIVVKNTRSRSRKSKV